MADNELKPIVDLSKMKTATSRIDLNKATVPGIPTAGIKLGAHAKATTGKLEISAGPSLDDDIYKRRTALLDTSHIPLSAAQQAPAAGPKTIRIGNRPTIRVNKPGVPATFSPGHPDEPSAADAAAGGGGRPAIRLKRPGGATVSVPAGGSGAATVSPALESNDGFVVRRDEEESSPVWAVVALLGVLAGIGVVVTQFLTKNLMPY
jgi:hypothetical protein